MNIQWLKEHGPCVNYAAGEAIPCLSEKSDEQPAMYILLSGSIDVIGRSPSGDMTKKVSSIVAGDVFGGREFFLGVDEFDYRVVDAATVFLLTEDSFNDISWAQPDILFEVFRSAYMPPRKPIQSAVPVSAPTTSSAAAPAAATAKAVSGSIFLPGHKTYSGKEFPMDEKLVYAKEYTCPFCKKKFQDFRIFSSKMPESQPMRFDLRRFYDNFNSEWYDIITCHHCYFSMFKSYFTDVKPMRGSEIESKLAAVRAGMPINFGAKRDINHVFTMHYLALLCCDAFTTTVNQLRGKVLGNLSWLYEDVEDREMEIVAATKAAEAYEESRKTMSLTPIQEQVTLLSIAGMQHRAGNDGNLQKYLFAVKTHLTGDVTYKNFAAEIMEKFNIADIETADTE